MKDQIREYVDQLFIDVNENKQLIELKEEIRSNLLEKVNDLISNGSQRDTALKEAIQSLGDMNELVGNLKKVSQEKPVIIENVPLDKIHVMGYVASTAILVFGALFALLIYVQYKEIYMAIATIFPFAMISVPIYTYLGLTQESGITYGMKPKRAVAYTLGVFILMLGVFIAVLTYKNPYLPNQVYEKMNYFYLMGLFIPFGVVSVSLFTYLGLTEKPRFKMNQQWQNHWVNYYKDEKSMILRGNISGALWVFAFALFILLGFLWSWLFSWIVFVFAVGCEIVIEAVFSSRK